MQQCDVLLRVDRARVMAAKHVNAGSSVPSQGKQVNPLTVQQSKRNGAVPKAIEASSLTMGPNPGVSHVHQPPEILTQNKSGVVSVFEVWQE